MKTNKLYIALFTVVLACSSLSAQQKHLLILQTSDTHSRIEPVEQVGDRDYNKGGFVRRATMLDQMRRKNPDLLLFDCGDFSQGTPYYNLFEGNAEIDFMNYMKYNAGTIGNHEFDLGLNNMARLFKRAKFPIVCSNYDFSATVLKGLVKPYIVLIRKGIRIGVFGLSPQPKGLVQEKNYKKTIYNDPVTTANSMASLLRYTERCDVVICLSHLGIMYDRILIPKTRNIDLILGGHSHTFMNAPESYTDLDGKIVKVLHSGAKGVKVAKIELTLEKK
jgi:5'-nucleotidase